MTVALPAVSMSGFERALFPVTILLARLVFGGAVDCRSLAVIPQIEKLGLDKARCCVQHSALYLI